MKQIISEVRKKVGESFAENSVKLEPDCLTALTDFTDGQSLDNFALKLGGGLPDYAASLEFR